MRLLRIQQIYKSLNMFIHFRFQYSKNLDE